MNHPAPLARQGRPPRGASLAALLALLLVLPVPPAASAGSGGGPAKAGVLLFLEDTDYHWAEVGVEAGSTALCATEAACRQLGLSLNYTTGQYGAFVTEIGGLKAPSDFSWWWYLLLWNATKGAWQEAPVGAGDLELSAGDAVCWCPNDSAPPVPNPLSKHPWPSFRGDSRNSGIARATSPVAGGVAWTADLANGPIDSTPAVAGGRVFVSTGGIYNWTTMQYERPPHLYSLDARSGKALWSAETSAAGWQVSSPAVQSGRVVIGTSDGRVLAFAEATGSLLWTFSTGASPTGVTASPVVTAGAIYIAAGDGRLYALSPDGKEVWNATLGGPVYMSTPALSEGRLFAGTDNGTFWCVAQNGTPVWNFSTEGKIRCSPVVSEGKVHVIATVYEGWTAVRSVLHRLDCADGRQSSTPLDLPATTSSPVVTGGRIVLGSNAGFHQIGGPVGWDIGTEGPVQSSPVLCGGEFYFTENSRNGTLHAFSASKGGLELWNFTPAPRQYLLSSPAVSDGRLYFGSDNGKVYCLGAAPANLTGQGDERAPYRPSTAALAAGLAVAAAFAVLVVARHARRGRGRQDE